MINVQSNIRLILSSKNDELNGRTITNREFEILKKALNTIIPEWFIDILLDFPLIGCYFELSEDLDISRMGVEMQWMTPTQTVSESTQAYPAIAAVSIGYLPVGICLNSSGDYYFVNIKNIDLPLVRIPHIAVDKNNKLIEEDIELVCSNLFDFFERAKID